MQFGYFPQPRHYAENLLINPRGVINQANEADGVLSANQYFRDGWKAGANGAEVYVESDGFRLVSGSIVQVIENTFEVGTKLRANLDVVSGAPVFTLGGSDHIHIVADAAHIPLEISGNNSKFTRPVVAVGAEPPIYAERAECDESSRCNYFYKVVDGVSVCRYTSEGAYRGEIVNLNFEPMVGVPAVSITSLSGTAPSNPVVNMVNETYISLTPEVDWSVGEHRRVRMTLDARL